MSLILKRSFSLIAFLCISLTSMANLTISGIYTGNNLRVSNPVCEDGMGLTVLKVRVNGEIVPYILHGNEVEIDFRRAGIEVGTRIVVTIESDPFTRPTVLNPTALEAFGLFEDFKTKMKTSTSGNHSKETQPVIAPLEEEGLPKYR